MQILEYFTVLYSQNFVPVLLYDANVSGTDRPKVKIRRKFLPVLVIQSEDRLPKNSAYPDVRVSY